MINAKVTGLRGVELGVRDLNQSAAFYGQVWGLEPVGGEGDTTYLRGNDAEHHVLTLRERPTPGLLGVHFAVAARAVLGGRPARAQPPRGGDGAAPEARGVRGDRRRRPRRSAARGRRRLRL